MNKGPVFLTRMQLRKPDVRTTVELTAVSVGL